MNAGGGSNGSRLRDEVRLVIVESPDLAARLVDALDVADIGAWMWVESDHTFYFSPRVLTLLGLSPEPHADLMVRFLAGVHPDDEPALRALLDGQLPAGPFEIRYRFTPPDGPLRWIEDRGRVERDDAAQLVRQGGVVRDVTREVGHEQEFREADARLEALVNALPFAVWSRSGPHLTVTHQNAESIAWWGDLRGRALADAPPQVRELWQSQLGEVVTGQIVRLRSEQVRNGDTRLLNEIIAPVVVEEQVTGVVGVALDITEEERTRRFETLLTEITTEFASRSADTLDTAFASALERVGRFFGASVASLSEIADDRKMSVTHWWLAPESGRDRPFATEINDDPVQELFTRLAQNIPVIIRSQSDLPEGSAERAWLEARRLESFALMPTRQSDGPVIVLGLAAVSGQVIDWPPDILPLLRLAATVLSGVVARVHAEINQKNAERRLQETQRLESLGVLAGGIAHDFNNLLTTILGNASLLRTEHDSSPEIVAPLEQIEIASKRAAELCRHMLSYAGRGRFALRPLDLNSLLQESQPLLRVTVPKTSVLELSLAPALPAVLGDESQLRQLLMNLMINAAEALGDRAGVIALRTSHRAMTGADLSKTAFSPQLADGEYVSLSVYDTGEGMTPETLPRIFDPFFTTKFTGRGLGLAAVVGIVRAHKGALRVESRHGEGTTFELLLPAQPGVAVKPALGVASTHDVPPAAWRSSGTVLVVDDEFGVRDLVRNVLERAGLTVLLAEDGYTAVEMLEKAGSDVRMVLLDFTMPGIDGRQALAAMRRLRPDLPAVLMSGYTAATIASSSTVDFLQKPFTPNALRNAIRKALNE